jgi:hypothetical protein
MPKPTAQSLTAARFHDPGPFQIPINLRDRVGVDAQIDRPMTHGEQLCAGSQPAE